jgi:hypothetical protein
MTRLSRTITSIVAFTSADVVRKFTMQARRAVAVDHGVDKYAVPSACIRASRAVFSSLR